ncbi:serine/arginine repetitive matrix protein 3 isoform X2 [Gouania willdenowi]|nr:serine/arginine repetitive matrix protein 3 isoform X2 [Gouania willdenowi]
MYDAAKVPSPKDSANGVAQHVVPGTEAEGSTTVLQAKTEEGQTGTEEKEELKAEPVLVKKPHREILDHERKRRVELKCMELQEMMEEQGYTEEEIRQKVSTFRQMLMDKEGVITRDDSHTQPGVKHLHYPPDQYDQEQEVDDCEDGNYNHYYHSDNSQSRVKRKSSSSPSPRPKKRKKKKSGRRRSRFSSSSPMRREKKKKSGKKHKRDRSMSGSRKKRRHRSGSPKNKHKYKTKQRKRSPGETPSRCSQHQGSCCSSRSASLSSARSASRSPTRLNSKQRSDGQKPSGTPLFPGPHSPATRHNGEVAQRTRNSKAGRLNHSEDLKGNDCLFDQAPTRGNTTLLKLHLLTTSSANTQSSRLKKPKLHNVLGRSQTAAGAAQSVDGLKAAVGCSMIQTLGRSGRKRVQNKSVHSPARSSDSAHSQDDHTHRGRHSYHQRKTKGSHSSKRHRRPGRGQAHRSLSASPARHSHTSGRKNEESRSKVNLRQRSSSWSSGRSSSRSASRDKALSKTKSPHIRQNNSRERESPNRSDTDSRTRRRSRSYSPIRKRRRDSPSFMEARRITSARKRPIPYYRPSPSSSSYDSSPSRSSCSSYSRSRSRSHTHTHTRSRSRSWSRSKSRTWSRSRSRSHTHHSYYSNSSNNSPAF